MKYLMHSRKNRMMMRLLKTLIFLGNLNEKNDNYTRDILSIVKVFDNIKQNNFKEIFIVNEFSL